VRCACAERTDQPCFIIHYRLALLLLLLLLLLRLASWDADILWSWFGSIGLCARLVILMDCKRDGVGDRSKGRGSRVLSVVGEQGVRYSMCCDACLLFEEMVRCDVEMSLSGSRDVLMSACSWMVALHICMSKSK
jgi:hypothetical protein